MRIRKILVIKHGALGDMITATGAFSMIRLNHPEDYIVLMTDARFKKMGEMMGWFDEVIVDPRKSGLKHFLDLRTLLRHACYDRVYDLQNSSRTMLYYWLMGPGNRPEWSGIAPGCSHRQIRKDRENLPASQRFADQLQVAGLSLFGRKELLPDVSWMHGEIAIQGLQGTPYALLVPGSSRKNLEKRWPARSYASLASFLLGKGIHPVLIGDTGEADAIQEIRTLEPNVYDLSGKLDLFSIATLARDASIAVGNDTGPTHLIAAAGCNTIVPWSSFSDPGVYAPRGQNVSVIYEAKLEDLKTDRVAMEVERYLQPEPQGTGLQAFEEIRQDPYETALSNRQS